MPFWSRLFGGSPVEEPASAAEEHKGYRITPRPIRRAAAIASPRESRRRWGAPCAPTSSSAPTL
jgi:hypothetical protein